MKSLLFVVMVVGMGSFNSAVAAEHINIYQI